MAWIATGWPLAFAGVNAALYVVWWRRTVPRGRLGTQQNPALAALVTTVRRHKGATVRELLHDARFARFRKLLQSRRPPLRSTFGTYRVPALTAALATAFGLSMHAMIARCPVPGLPALDAGMWTTAWIVLWAVLAALAAIRPPALSRPWPRFTRRCRAAVTRALAGEDTRTRYRVSVVSSSAPPTPVTTARSCPRGRPSRAGRTAPRWDLGDVTDSDSGDLGGGD
ncbi:hypothetical protein ACWC10_25990 [Streptomyces sp. NPDC001595]|uniref:hypothetical protein n=1 Tax=Streptomyces sp. NPDC001532 TaxID=3154520 RepID=UPI00331D5481